MRISFTVAGDPVAQPRQRHRLIKAQDGREFVHNYTPADSPVTGWKEAIYVEAERHKPHAPFEGPIRCALEFMMRRPKCHYDAKGCVRANAPKYRDSKPDVDNLAKAVLDALTRIGFWRDDAQIAELWLTKRYANKWPDGNMELPGVRVEIENELEAH
jgi:Holliday junction resolvase RusA-like endonuclease